MQLFPHWAIARRQLLMLRVPTPLPTMASSVYTRYLKVWIMTQSTGMCTSPRDCPILSKRNDTIESSWRARRVLRWWHTKLISVFWRYSELNRQDRLRYRNRFSVVHHVRTRAGGGSTPEGLDGIMELPLGTKICCCRAVCRRGAHFPSQVDGRACAFT